MHCLEILRRNNAEWPRPQSPAERHETAILHLEERLGIAVDRTDPMLPAIARMEMWLTAWCNHKVKRSW